MNNLKIMSVVITLVFVVIFVNSCGYEENENKTFEDIFDFTNIPFR